jgi:hypothetical protein
MPHRPDSETIDARHDKIEPGDCDEFPLAAAGS